MLGYKKYRVCESSFARQHEKDMKNNQVTKDIVAKKEECPKETEQKFMLKL